MNTYQFRIEASHYFDIKAKNYEEALSKLRHPSAKPSEIFVADYEWQNPTLINDEELLEDNEY